MQALFDQAVALHNQGSIQKAVAIYAQILQNQPKHPLVNARVAMALAQLGQARKALPHYDVAIAGLPNEAQLLIQAASVASQCADNARAEGWLRRALELDPSNQHANEQMAGVLVALHKEQEALDHIRTAIKGDPKSASAHNLRGMIECRLGEVDKGYKSFQKSVQLNPGQLGSIRNLIIYGKGKNEPLLEQLIPQLEQKYRAPGMAPAAKMNLAYILFMYYEKRVPATAIRYLNEGNALNRKSYHYSHDETLKTFKAIIDCFTPELVEVLKDMQVEDDSAIFVLGMPRSGTTLIEQILSAHSSVGAEGEIEDLRQVFEHYSKQLLSDQVSVKEKAAVCVEIAREYLAHVRTRQSAQYFTDKMPYNFMLTGLIAAAMPNAKIVHCTRDPLETCFSIFKQNFSGSHSYTNDLAELGQYFNLYVSMMRHWEKLFPGRVYEANYERMVADSEVEINALLSHCGLEPEPRCFAFYKSKRTVRTASTAQVRQPIYKDSLKASAPFEAQLDTLIRVLESGQGGDLGA